MNIDYQRMGKYFVINSKDHPGKILEVKYDDMRYKNTVIVAKVSIDETNFKDHQLWFHDQDTFTIRSKLNGCCINIIDGFVVVDEYSTQCTTMMWIYLNEKLETEDDYEMILSSADDCLTGGSVCVVRPDKGGVGQRWIFVYCKADFFHIQLTNSDLVLDVKGSCKDAGAKIIAYKINFPPTDNQLWYEDMEGLLRSKLNGLVIDTSSTTPMLLPFERISEHQHWVIIGDRICQRIKPKVCLEIKKNVFLYDNVIVAKLSCGNSFQSFAFDLVPSMTEKRTLIESRRRQIRTCIPGETYRRDSMVALWKPRVHPWATALGSDASEGRWGGG